jgi:plasmid stabilization system protein ParE
MAYVVSITSRAQQDLSLLYEHINAGHSKAGLKWYRGLKRAMSSLETLPYRCPVTHESERLRHLLYGRRPHVYRVIYRIFETEKQVEIVHIRHSRQSELTGADSL